MSEKGNLAQPCDVVYLYDGSLPGFLCCVFESVYTKQIPSFIWKAGEEQPTLMAQKYIDTDQVKAKRVYKSIPIKMSEEALTLIQDVFLSCLKDKEIKMLNFLLLGYKEGKSVTKMLGHNDVAPLLKAQRHLLHEAHLYTGFVRFADYGGTLAATISPKNFVLPYFTNHFVGRYSGEDFVIFDDVHKAALIYKDRKTQITAVENMTFLEESEEEQNYQKLWKQFYKTIAIKERINPNLRRNNMPKRYWAHMTEMKELL